MSQLTTLTGVDSNPGLFVEFRYTGQVRRVDDKSTAWRDRAGEPVFRVVATNGRAFVPFDKFDTDTTAILVNIKGVPDPVVVMRDSQGEFSAV
ncbi:MAG: hypothetical protein IIB25_09080, partial [Chloroflexi bacterium]|nr:hypothetical protein [Chloroflexota bacterium]